MKKSWLYLCRGLEASGILFYFLNVILKLNFCTLLGGLSFVGERIQDNCPLHNPNWHSLYADANNLVIYKYSHFRKASWSNTLFIYHSMDIVRPLSYLVEISSYLRIRKKKDEMSWKNTKCLTIMVIFSKWIWYILQSFMTSILTLKIRSVCI